MKIDMNGECIFPKITFDRKEIIMPTVPLNILSKCVINLKQTFRIFNEGYENFNLKHKFVFDYNILKLKLIYPEGKTLNVSQKKLRLEV